MSSSCPAYRFISLNTHLNFNKGFPPPLPLLIASLSQLQTEGKGRPKASVGARTGFVTKENDHHGALPLVPRWGLLTGSLPQRTQVTSKGSSFPLHKAPRPGLTSAELRIKESGR